MRPWRLEILLRYGWKVFGTYKTKENAEGAIPWAKRNYFGVLDTRIKTRDGWPQ